MADDYSKHYDAYVTLIHCKVLLFNSVYPPEDDWIYWVDTTERTISRIKRDLSHRQTIINEGISGVESVAVDWIAGL